MIIKGLWDKASEYGSKAKNMANDYLNDEKKNKKPGDAEERDKNFAEKFNKIRKEIEVFKTETTQKYEGELERLNIENKKLAQDNEGLKTLNSQLKKDFDILSKTFQEMEKEKNTKIKELIDAQTEKERRLVELEKSQSDISTAMLKLKEDQVVQTFNTNFEEFEKKLNEIIESSGLDKKIKEHLQSLELRVGDNKLDNSGKIISNNNADSNKTDNSNNDHTNEETVIASSNEESKPEDSSPGQNETESQVDDTQTTNSEVTTEKQEELSQNHTDEKVEHKDTTQLVQAVKEELMALLNQNSSNLKEEIKTFIKENMHIFNDKLNEYVENSTKVSTENSKLQEEGYNLKNELLKSKEDSSELSTKLETVESNLKESEKAFKDLIEVETSLKEKNKELENEIRRLNDSLNYSAELVTAAKTETENFKNKYEANSQNEKQLRQTLKQVFLSILDDDAFIDVIEKTFKNTDLQNIFEEVYRLSKLIPAYVLFRTQKDFFSSNRDLFKKMKKYNLNTDLEFYGNNFRTLNVSKLENADEETNIFGEYLTELCEFIDNIQGTISKQNKTISELNSNMKIVKDNLDDSKKNDTEKYDLLNKHVAKLQQECRDNVKTEKLLKENIESLEEQNKNLKVENDKFTSKLKNLTGLYDEVQKEKTEISDKIASLTNNCDTFKIENFELFEKIDQKNDEIKQLNERLTAVNKEREELNKKVSELEKLKANLSDQQEQNRLKDTEIIYLKERYLNIENLMESMKYEREHSSTLYKKQSSELVTEVDNLREIIREKEEKLQNQPVENKDLEKMEKLITDLEIENKHLKEQKETIKKHSEEILKKVKNDLKDTEYLIDKRMISNILMKYFDRNSNDKLKLALLDTLANFMGYDNEERKKMGLAVNNTMMVANTNNNATTDKLKDLSDDIYNFILNA